MTISELVHFTLKPGTDVRSDGAEGKEVLDHVLKTISEQKGCQYLATGATVENHEDMDMVVGERSLAQHASTSTDTTVTEWPDLKHHEDFMAADYYAPFLDKAKSMVTGDAGSLTVNHVHAEPPLSHVTDKAPVVEMLLIYVPLDANDEVPGTITRFMDILAKNAQGFVTTAHGWVVEELEKEGLEGRFKAYFVAIGWESVEAHMAYRETEAFKESIPMLRALAKGLRVVSRPPLDSKHANMISIIQASTNTNEAEARESIPDTRVGFEE